MVLEAFSLDANQTCQLGCERSERSNLQDGRPHPSRSDANARCVGDASNEDGQRCTHMLQLYNATELFHFNERLILALQLFK